MGNVIDLQRSRQIIDILPYLPEYKVVAECNWCNHSCYMIVPKALATKALECPECGSHDMWVTKALGRRVRKKVNNKKGDQKVS